MHKAESLHSNQKAMRSADGSNRLKRTRLCGNTPRHTWKMDRGAGLWPHRAFSLIDGADGQELAARGEKRKLCSRWGVDGPKAEIWVHLKLQVQGKPLTTEDATTQGELTFYK
jgi:hypothetical protein